MKILKNQNLLPDDGIKDNIDYYQKAYNVTEDYLFQDKNDE